MEENKNAEWDSEFGDLVKKIKAKREETKRKRDNPFSHISILPVAMKVASQTLGMDLVSVQPMSMPKVSLMYMDYGESEEARLEREKREKYEKRQRVIDSLLGNTKEEPKETHLVIGELDHPDTTPNLTIEIKENNDAQVYNHLSQWATLVDSVTKDEKKKSWLNDYINMHNIHSSSGLV